MTKTLRYIFPCLLLLSLSISSFAQSTFQRTFGGTGTDIGNCVQQTSDGGYVIGGVSDSYAVNGAGYDDLYLIKTNWDGSTSWTKTFGSSTGSDVGSSVQQTSDGGYAMAGRSNTIGAGGNDIYFIKTSSDGASFWTKTYGGVGEDVGYSAQQTNDGGYVLTGYTWNFVANSNGNVWLIKTASDGTVSWTKTYGSTGAWDYGSSVQQTADGGYVIGGLCNGADSYLIKTSSDGSTSWNKRLGIVGFYDQSTFAQQTADGGYALFGYVPVGGTFEVYLIKTISDGTVSWTKTYGGAGTDYGYCGQQTADGGYVITGSTTSYGAGGTDVYLIKTTSDGSVSWTKTFGGTGTDESSFVKQTTDGGYVIVGKTNSYGAGDYDVYLIKTDSNGISGCHETSPAAPTVSSAGTTGTVGSSSSPSPTVSSGGTSSAPTSTILDACTGLPPLPLELLNFNATVENNSKVKCDWTTASEYNNHFFSLEHSRDAYNFEQFSQVQSLAIGGYSNIPLDYFSDDHDPYMGISYYRLKQVDYNGQYNYSEIRSVYIGGTDIISVYPNPSSNGYIQYTIGSKEANNVTVQVIDVLGRVCTTQTETLKEGITEKKLSTSNMRSGTYLLRITRGDHERIQKHFVIK